MDRVVRKNWAHELPDEILLMILEHVVILPRGISGVRWFAMNKLRLQPLLKLKGLTHIFEQLFYSKNKLKLSFAPRQYLACDVPPETAPIIVYPQRRLSNFVRRLELHLAIKPREEIDERTYFPNYNGTMDFQLNWLRDMAKGRKGFNHVGELTLCLSSSESAFNEKNISLFCKWLDGEDYPEGTTPVTIERPVKITFSVEKLSFAIYGHTCESDDCEPSSVICPYNEVLRKFFTN